MKEAQVVWSDEALVDLEIIYDFLAVKSQPAAQRTIEGILARTKQLEAFPESGAIQELVKGKAKKYRGLVEGNYKIIYSFLADRQTVFIEIVFDARQNPAKLKEGNES